MSGGSSGISLDPYMTPQKTPRIRLGFEDTAKIGVSSPFTSAVELASVVPANVKFITFIVKTNVGELLVSSYIDANGAQMFGLPLIKLDAASLSILTMSDLYLEIRRIFRLNTGLMIDFTDSTDNQLAVRVYNPYTSLPDAYYTGMISVCVHIMDSEKSDLCNARPAERLFLQFVRMDEFADDSRYPKNSQMSACDIDEIYAISSMSNYQTCTFLPGSAGPLLPASGGTRRITTRAPQLGDFFGFDDKRTPAKFNFEDYADQIESNLQFCESPLEKYRLWRACFQEDAYTYIKAFEGLHPPPFTFEMLKAYMLTLAPKVLTRETARDDLRKLKMLHFTEKSYLEFQRRFIQATAIIQGYDDNRLRVEFVDKLHPNLIARIVDNNKCPSDPKDVNVVVPDTNPPELFTIKHLQDLAIDVIRREATKSYAGEGNRKGRVSVFDRLGETDSSGTGGTGKRLSKADKKRARKAKNAAATGKDGGATLNSAYTKEQRIKACANTGKYPQGHGKNGKFNDGTPKTCNNCNSPDHLADKCDKPRQNVPSNSVAASNLNKRAKKDITSALRAYTASTASSNPGANSAMSAPPVPTPVQPPRSVTFAASTGNEVAVARGGVSVQRVQQLLTDAE